MPITRHSNQHRRSRRAYAERLGRPLSNQQKAALALLAKEAYAAQGGDAMLGMTEREFRHEEVAKACGKGGLTECSQDDYNPIKARFLDLKGESGRALNAHLAHQTEDVSVARFKLQEALKLAGKGEAYAAAIARHRFKCALEQCSAKQLWQLVFTLNKRRA